MPAFGQLKMAVRLYVLTAVVASAVLLVVGFWLHPLSASTTLNVGDLKFTQGTLATILYLAVGTQVMALLPVRWRGGTQTTFEPFLIATGLFAPGGAVGLVAWLATFDGQLPNQRTRLWVLVFNRAALGIPYVLVSLLVSTIPRDQLWSLPVQTVIYAIGSSAINLALVSGVVAVLRQQHFLAALGAIAGGVDALNWTFARSVSGGILFFLALTPVGMVIAPALAGLFLGVRASMVATQRQNELTDQTLELAAQALDARDPYTQAHSVRVGELASQLGRQLGLGARECERLQTAGSLHDLGMIGIRDDIFRKPGPLTPDEWQVMRRHPDIGADMIAQHSALADVAPMVRHHHERWDGTGYPSGLKGESIPFGARIVSVADAFDTLTGARLYRRSVMTPIAAVEDIGRKANRWYDPAVVDALRALVDLSVQRQS